MAIRYFAAVCVGYGAFFGLLRAWLWGLAAPAILGEAALEAVAAS